ncbi:MAG: DUF349 domain-containing protein [Erysipelothrix sp.]|nr:DUF349 domain-containing protein [Erysipelothrix sp.]
MANNDRFDFNWDSFYTVSNNQKYEIINEVRRLDGTEDLEVLENLKTEWTKVQTDGDDPALEERFKKEIERYHEKRERVQKSIEGKKALIEKAHELKDSEDFFVTAEKYKELQAQWREFGYSGREYNDKLWEEFSEVNDYFFERRNQFYEQQNQEREKARERKEELIKQAEEIKDSTDWYNTSKIQRELMDAWRKAGFASREVENELWERFNSARQVFYKNQEAFFTELRAKEAEAKAIKEKLIQETHELKDSFDFDTVRQRFDDIMEEWKAAGHSGRRHEENLWQEFREGRDHFFARMQEAQKQSREERRAEIFDRIDELNQQIDSLEDMKTVIEGKLAQLESRPEDEETLKEIEETKIYLENNDKQIEAYLEELKNLNDEIERV